MSDKVDSTRTPPSRSWMSAGWTTAWSKSPIVSTRICRFLPLIFCPRHTRSDRCRPPFFSALHALAVDHTGRRASVSPSLLTALHVERMVDVLQGPVIVPEIEVVMQRALRREILGHISPLTARAENVHDAINAFAFVLHALASATLGRRNQRFDERPLIVGQSLG